MTHHYSFNLMTSDFPFESISNWFQIVINPTKSFDFQLFPFVIIPSAE